MPHLYIYILYIRRPLPSLGPGGAAPGITAGVRLWPARTSACTVNQTPNPLPLPSQVTANTLPCSGSPLPAPGHVAILHLKRARSTAHHDTEPVCGPLPLCHCLPRSPRARCPAAAVLCQRLAMSPYYISRVSKRARSTVHHDTKPLCGPLPLCRCLPRSP